MEPDEFSEIVERCGGKATLLSNKERWQILQSWRHVFSRELYERTGKWQHNGFDWHTFSYDFAPAENGAKALDSYRSQSANAFYVIPQDELLPGFLCADAQLPDFSGCFLDVYIFPRELAWTMAFTHESHTSMELGPFFARGDRVAPVA